MLLAYVVAIVVDEMKRRDGKICRAEAVLMLPKPSLKHPELDHQDSGLTVTKSMPKSSDLHALLGFRI